MASDPVEKAKRLIVLAVSPGAALEESRTAALLAVRLIHESGIRLVLGAAVETPAARPPPQPTTTPPPQPSPPPHHAQGQGQNPPEWFTKWYRDFFGYGVGESPFVAEGRQAAREMEAERQRERQRAEAQAHAQAQTRIESRRELLVALLGALRLQERLPYQVGACADGIQRPCLYCGLVLGGQAARISGATWMELHDRCSLDLVRQAGAVIYSSRGEHGELQRHVQTKPVAEHHVASIRTLLPWAMAEFEEQIADPTSPSCWLCGEMQPPGSIGVELTIYPIATGFKSLIQHELHAHCANALMSAAQLRFVELRMTDGLRHGEIEAIKRGTEP